MQYLRDLLAKPYPSPNKAEVERMLDELVRIGKTEDYLSEHPGSGFNAQSRHARAVEIGKRLNDIGGMALMEYADRYVTRRLGKQLGSHLEYAWADIGKWVP